MTDLPTPGQEVAVRAALLVWAERINPADALPRILARANSVGPWPHKTLHIPKDES